MKIKQNRRILVLVLIFAFILSVANISFAYAEINYGETPELRLGLGYNALTGLPITETGSNPTIAGSKIKNWLDLSKAKDENYYQVSNNGDGLLYQESKAETWTSSFNMVKSMGFEFDNTTSAKFPISAAKVNLENKFSYTESVSNQYISEELYYHYTYTAIKDSYSLVAGYESLLSDEFMADIVALGDGDNDAKIKAFYEKWGSHMLTDFQLGGELQLSAWALFTSQNETVSKEISDKFTAGVEVAGASVTNVTEVKNTISSNIGTSNSIISMDFNAFGGKGTYVDVSQSSNLADLEFNTANIENWVNTIAENSVLLPEYTQWVPVWEVLPETLEYENIRNKLREYFEEQTAGMQGEFFEKFCFFEDRVNLSDYTYLSPKDVISQNITIDKKTPANNTVAPGATLFFNEQVKDSPLDIDKVTFVLEDQTLATSTTNGIIKISDTANAGDIVKVNVMLEDIKIYEISFVVKEEGENIFAGGYGTKESPYILTRPAHILALADNPTLAKDSSKHYLLMPEDKEGNRINEIDMSGESSFKGIPEFAGTFDGNGYRIYGFNINKTANRVGFFYKNTGTIKNLTLGTQNLTSIDGYSARVHSHWTEGACSGYSWLSIGGLVATNEGTIDNCHAENIKVYGRIDDVKGDENEDKHNIWTGGIVGYNDTNAVITRCSVISCDISGRMCSEKDTCDDKSAWVGGLVGDNLGEVSYILVKHSIIKAYLEGDGMLVNKANLSSAAGSILGGSGSGSSLKYSVSYNNVPDAQNYQIDNYVKGSDYTGDLVGIRDNATIDGCYTSDGGRWVIGNDSSTNGKEVSFDTLKELFAPNEHFAEVDGELIINPVSAIKANSSKDSYVVGDELDPQKLTVYGTTAKADKKFQQWNKESGEFETVNFNQFRVDGFSSETVGSHTATITAYGGLTAEYKYEIYAQPVIVIDDVDIVAGETATVDIALKNNPGIASMRIEVSFDSEILTLTDVKFNSEMGGQYMLPSSYKSPVILNWVGTADAEGDFVFVTLTFKVSENANVGGVTNISISYDEEDVYDITETNINFVTEGGALTVINYLPGDINNDGTINNKDITRLLKYLSNWDVEVNENALDVNGDGSVNNKDVTRLLKYMSGWDVELH